MAQRLLEDGSGWGGVADRDSEMDRLVDENSRLKAETSRLMVQNRQLDEALRLERIKSQTLESGIKDLRGILFPLYRSLRLVFGEMDAMGVVETASPGGAPQFDPKWTSWMEKFGRDQCVSRVIKAILDHGPLSRSQLRQATKSGWSTLDAATTRLKNLQLIEKSGDRWNLKG